VVRLQKLLKQEYLQLACRHHVLELVSGASCSLVYHDNDKPTTKKGKTKRCTESPEEPIFKAFAAAWKDVDKSDCRTFAPSCREQGDMCHGTVVFLLQWLDDESLRHDCGELVELAILFLGGVFPSGRAFSFKAPGAFHHARLMSKIIYKIKLALFGHQLPSPNIEAPKLTKIKSLASFLCLYYVKEWCTAPVAADAPINDLLLYKKLCTDTAKATLSPNSYPIMYYQFLEAAREKLFKHSWYLSEGLVVLCLASSRLGFAEKVKV